MNITKEEFTNEPKLYDDQALGVEYQIVYTEDGNNREKILGRFSEEDFAVRAFDKYIEHLNKNRNLKIYDPSDNAVDCSKIVEFKNSSQSGVLFVRSKEIIKEKFNFRAAEAIFNPDYKPNYNRNRQ